MVNMLSYSIQPGTTLEDLENKILKSQQTTNNNEYEKDEEKDSPYNNLIKGQYTREFRRTDGRIGSYECLSHRHARLVQDSMYLTAKGYDRLLSIFQLLAKLYPQFQSIDLIKNAMKSENPLRLDRRLGYRIAQTLFSVGTQLPFASTSNRLMQIFNEVSKLLPHLDTTTTIIHTMDEMNTGVFKRSFFSAIKSLLNDFCQRPFLESLASRVTIKGEDFFPVWEKNSFRMVVPDPSKVMGSGSWGIVLSSTEFSDEGVYQVAQKFSKITHNLEKNKSAIAAVENEILAMNKLEAMGIPGFSTAKKVVNGSYTTDLFEKNFLEWAIQPGISYLIRMNTVRYLLNYAYTHHHQNQLFHRDLSARNIVVNTGETLEITDFAIIDLSSMHFLGDPIDFNWVGTPHIISEADRVDLIGCRERMDMAIEEDNKAGIREIYKEGLTILARQELFAWSSIFFLTLTGQYPYPVKQGFQNYYYCNPEKSLPLHLLKDFTPNMTEFFQKLLSHNPKERLTWKETMQAFDLIQDDSSQSTPMKRRAATLLSSEEAVAKEECAKTQVLETNPAPVAKKRKEVTTDTSSDILIRFSPAKKKQSLAKITD